MLVREVIKRTITDNLNGCRIKMLFSEELQSLNAYAAIPRVPFFSEINVPLGMVPLE